MSFPNPAQITPHARLRMQQRAIPAEALELVLEFGRSRYDHRGARIVFLPRQLRRKLLATLEPTARRRLEKKLDTYCVCRTGCADVITVGHREARIWTT